MFGFARCKFYQQDHLRWRYSTVIHLGTTGLSSHMERFEQRKDLNKENIKEPKDKIELLQWGGCSNSCFFLHLSSRLRRSGQPYVLLPCVCIAEDILHPSDTPKLQPRYPPDFPRNPQDIPKISPRYPQDIPKISQRYPKDIPKISPASYDINCIDTV